MENQVTNNNDEIEIDLGEIFHLILSRLGLIILSGIILGVISIIGTMLFITPQYESTTKIMVLNKQDSNTLTSADMQTSTQLTKDYAELIKSRTVLEGVIAQLNLNITYQQLLGKLTVDTSTDSRIVTIIVSDEDPYTASEMANAIRDMAAEHIQSVMDIALLYHDAIVGKLCRIRWCFRRSIWCDRWTFRCYHCNGDCDHHLSYK